jgi:hypothetical protein
MTTSTGGSDGLDGRMAAVGNAARILRHALAVIVVAVLVVVVSQWLDRYLILDDDAERGHNYLHRLQQFGFDVSYFVPCQDAAEEFYGEPIADPHQYGDPTPAEKAFFHACSGYTVGGFGGGQGAD